MDSWCERFTCYFAKSGVIARLEDFLQMEDDQNGMIDDVYNILFKYRTWKHDTDCPDYDTAGEGDSSPGARGSSDRREET